MPIFGTNYKLNDEMVVLGFGEADEASELVEQAHAAWRGLRLSND